MYHRGLNGVLFAREDVEHGQFASGRIAHSSRIDSPLEPLLECYWPMYPLERHRTARVLSGPRWDLPRGRQRFAGHTAHPEGAQKVALKGIAVEKDASSYGLNSWELQRCVALVQTS